MEVHPPARRRRRLGSFVRRAARLAILWLAAPSLLAALASLAMWRRSLGALDELSGSVGFTRFTIDSFGGRAEALVNRPYRLRRGVSLDEFPAHASPTLGELELHDDPDYRGDHLYRTRWPIGQTSKWPVDAMLFPAPEANAWIAWAREGPGRYDGCLSVTVPYWLATLAFAAAPTVAIASIVRRRRRALRPHACAACGYDCRASPERCPECGTARVAATI